MRLTLELPELVVDHLRELADAHGSSPERVVTSLVEREYVARAVAISTPSPWQVTERAITQAVALLGGRWDREAARGVLETACVDAAHAERERRRQPTRRGDGCLQYRGPKPHRFTLIVEESVNGSRALVGVTRSG